MVTTSEFDDVKARLARIENKRRLTDSRNTDKPSLRKSGAGSGDSSVGQPVQHLQPQQYLQQRRQTNPASPRQPELARSAPSCITTQVLGAGCDRAPTGCVIGWNSSA